MKKFLVMTMAVLGLSSAFAQQRETFRADVPFAFRVADAVLPAGEYTISQNTLNGVVYLRSVDGKPAAGAITHGVAPNVAGKASKLVFNKYGDTYFLSEVWASTVYTGWKLRATPAEREFAKGAAVEVAWVPIQRK